MAIEASTIAVPISFSVILCASASLREGYLALVLGGGSEVASLLGTMKKACISPLFVFLFIVECLDTRKRLATKKLQSGSTSGRNMVNFIGHTCLSDGRYGIPTSNDAGGRAFRYCPSNGHCACGKLINLKDTQEPIPKNGFSRGNVIFETGDGFRANVQTHPLNGSFLNGSGFSFSRRVDLIGYHMIDG